MTRLILMRHAKSSWKEAGQTDHQRPLNGRGRRDAPEMAKLLVDAGWTPDLALVSDAARTEETWAWMHDAFGGPPMQLLPSLYHGGLQDIREALEAHAGSARTVLVLGHNPGWEEAASRLCRRLLTLSTANAALLSNPEPWGTALGRHDWKLDGLLTPPVP